VKIIVRGFDLLGLHEPGRGGRRRAADAIYGETGDDTLHGEVGTT